MKLFRTLTLLITFTVAGCAGTQMNPSPSVANGPASQFASGPASPAQRIKHDKASFKRALYVVEDDSNAIKIFSNGNYRELGVITDGISSPLTETMDQRANLYVGNTGTDDVTEYPPGDTSPSFTYNASMTYPEAVAVDHHGNLYEADGNGYVNQYFQGLNTLTQSCPKPSGTLFPTALAVDASGDVFVSYYSIYSSGGLYEFKGGLKYCKQTYLSAMGSENTSGLALDVNENLIAGAEGTEGVGIYVIAPPYSSITRTIGSYGGFFGLSLNKKNKLVFAAQYVGGSKVSIFNYQTGALVKVLDATYGITDPLDVVDAPNAVY